MSGARGVGADSRAPARPGWLVVEDLFTVVALVLLPVIFGENAASGRELVLALGLTAVRVVVLAGSS
ncbi:MAG: hypothetical protein ABR606_08715 [Vicinamibacterales bacterium]